MFEAGEYLRKPRSSHQSGASILMDSIVFNLTWSLLPYSNWWSNRLNQIFESKETHLFYIWSDGVREPLQKRQQIVLDFSEWVLFRIISIPLTKRYIVNHEFYYFLLLDSSKRSILQSWKIRQLFQQILFGYPYPAKIFGKILLENQQSACKSGLLGIQQTMFWLLKRETSWKAL